MFGSMLLAIAFGFLVFLVIPYILMGFVLFCFGFFGDK